jgi:hypothetical protein
LSTLQQKTTKGETRDTWKDNVQHEQERWKLLTGDKQRRIAMDGGEKLRRRLYFLDSKATEEGGGEEEEKTLSSSSECSSTRRHIN